MKNRCALFFNCLLIAAAPYAFADDFVNPSGAASTSYEHQTRAKGELRPPFKNSQNLGDRDLEIRVGPRFTEVAGSGRLKNSQNFAIFGISPKKDVDLRRDLGMDSVYPGIQFDIDFVIWKRCHIGLDYAADFASELTTLPSDISFSDSVFQKGTVFSSDVSHHQIDYFIGYDVIRNHTFKLTPFIGGKSTVTEITLKGTELREVNPSATAFARNTASATFVRNETDDVHAPEAGFDFRINFTENLYWGITPSGGAIDDLYFIQGQTYLGYDFKRDLGIRGGFDAFYSNFDKSSSTQAELGLGSIYLQVVWGF
jgi:hypothetical protein